MSYLLAPNDLVLAEDAVQLSTTYERLAKHLMLMHNEPEWILYQRGIGELEAIHDIHHAKGNKTNHSHCKPVRIVGFEPKRPKRTKNYLSWEEYNR